MDPGVTAALIMDPGVKAAWISSSVALAVAVIGVIATGIAQGRGAKTAHANALALFKQQAEVQDRLRAEEVAEQRRIRDEDAAERRRTAFLADRRAAYARFSGAMKRNGDAIKNYNVVNDKYKTDQVTETPEEKAAWREELLSGPAEIAAAGQQRLEALHDVRSALEDILMLAPDAVFDAAQAWFGYRARDETDDDYVKASARFLFQARMDLGVRPPAGPPVA
jgi:hypothetical protein